MASWSIQVGRFHLLFSTLRAAVLLQRVKGGRRARSTSIPAVIPVVDIEMDHVQMRNMLWL
jgi:hypothetical protein